MSQTEPPHQQQHTQHRYRVLFLRSHSKICAFSLIAHGLQHSQMIEFMQYPPLPAHVRPKLDKRPHAEEAWEDLTTHQIATPRELTQKLSSGFFDCVLLVDHNAELTCYSRMTSWQKLKMWGKRLRGNRQRAIADYQYMTSFPFTLNTISQYAPIAVVDLDDYPYLRPETREALEQSTAYFKREIPYNRFVLYHHFFQNSLRQAQKDEQLTALSAKIQGIPLGIQDEKFSKLRALHTEKQDIDVFWAGRISSTMRAKAVEQLIHLQKTTSWKIVMPTERLSFQEFYQTIARSKVTISVEGGGWDCDRHYEAVALGSVPLINRPTVDAVWWRDMPEVLFFENDFSNFVTRLETLLTNGPLRKQCLQHADQQVKEHMLWSKIVEYMVTTTLKTL